MLFSINLKNKRKILLFLYTLLISSKDTYLYESEDKANRIQQSSLSKEFTEISKIMLMSMFVCNFHGIIHDSISVNICFDYLSSTDNHHGRVMRDYFPSIHESQSKLGHAVVWGLVSTFIPGIISGCLWSYAAMNNPEVLTWCDILPYCLALSATTLAFSGLVSYLNYQEYDDLYAATEAFHDHGYLIGALGAVGLAVFFRYKPKNLFKRVSPSPTGLHIDFTPYN